MPKTTPEAVRAAIRIVLSDTKAYPTTLNWAVRRLQQAVGAPDHELKDRLLYILGNMTHWRHPKAKEVRNVFKQYIKEN